MSGQQITTPSERDALPAGIVVLDSQGTIAARHPSGVGVVFGDERPFPWHVLALPLTVLYRPDAPRPGETFSGKVTAAQFVGDGPKLCATCVEESDGCCDCCSEPSTPGVYLTVRLDDDEARVRSGHVVVTFIESGSGQ